MNYENYVEKIVIEATPQDRRKAWRRATGLFVVLGVAALLQALTYRVKWIAPFQLSSLLSWQTTMYAAVISTMALTRYYSRRESIFLFIGITFFGVMFIVGYESFVISDFVVLRLPASTAQLAVSSWTASSSLLAILLLVSLWYLLRSRKNAPFSLKPAYLYMLTAGLAATIVVLTLVIRPPIPFYGQSLFGRPHELVLASLFLLLVLGYLYRGKWRSSSFDYWLTLSMVALFASHALFMAFSRELNDLEYVYALSGRLIAFMLVLVGLLVSSYKLFKQSQSRQRQYAALNVSLEREQTKSKRTLEVIQSKDWELGKNLEELNITKRAMLNVLEDFEAEKRKLTTEKAKDEAIITSIGEGLVVTDVERRVTFINRAGELMVGRTLAELRGKVWPEVLPAVTENGKPLTKTESPLYRAIQTVSTVSGGRGLYYSRPDGTKFPVGQTASSIVVNKKPIGGIVVFKDITVETEVDRAKTEFVSLASHQLRTPLSTVSWYAEMLLSGDAGKLGRDQRQYVQEVYQANRRMVELVNALLNVSRLELGTFAVEPITLDLVEQVKTVTGELAHQIEGKKQKLVERYDPDLPKIKADPNLVRIIFQNLVSNAVKYTPDKGTITVAISTAKKGHDFGGKILAKDSYIIEVKDTGFGIPRKQQHLIFTKLFRADNVKEKDTDGTGLGLYIIKSIVDQVGGTIHFVSRENKGTSFFVSIPLAGMPRRVGTKRLSAAREHA